MLSGSRKAFLLRFQDEAVGGPTRLPSGLAGPPEGVYGQDSQNDVLLFCLHERVRSLQAPPLRPMRTGRIVGYGSGQGSLRSASCSGCRALLVASCMLPEYATTASCSILVLLRDTVCKCLSTMKTAAGVPARLRLQGTGSRTMSSGFVSALETR